MPDNGWSSRTSAVSCSRLRLAGAALLSVVAAPLIAQAMPPLALVVLTAVTQDGHATEDWLAILRNRLSPAQYDSIAPLQKTLAPDEAAWDSLIHARAPAWIGLAAPITLLYSPAQPPAVVRVMVGNRGADDAFTADNHTIAFDLSRLVSIYGPASDPANGVRIDRFFRHEFSHILQKAWLAAHPWARTSPLNAALFDIWTEGLGNYYSLSDQWLDPQGQLTDRSRQTLAVLEPRFASNLHALACADSASAAPLLATLSSGPFDRKWGAIPAALWLASEPEPGDSALRRFIVAGPDGVWDLAARHIAPEFADSLRVAQRSARQCGQNSFSRPE